MPIQSEVHKNILIVRPVETLTKACAGEFEEFLQNEIDEGFRYVIFDFSQVSQVSSDGLLVVLKLINEIRKIGGEVLVTGLKSKVRVIFSVSGMFTLLEETEDLESAIEQMKEVQDAAGTRQSSDH
jgi:Ca-activated chloride channel homolog